MIINDIQFILTSWDKHNIELNHVRRTVFIEEQHVPEELEWDEFDSQSTHFLAFHDKLPIATTRLKPDGQIGRMAVIKNYRGKGIGSKLLLTAQADAKNNGYNMVYLHAQKESVSFYKQFDFVNNGIEFMDAGILHQSMYKILRQQ